MSAPNNEKWQELHDKSTTIEVRINPNLAIKKILESKNLIQKDSSNLTVLEIGSGFGRNLLYLAEHNFADEYFGIDITETAIDKAKNILSNHANIHLKLENAGEKLEFPDESIDCIFDIMSAITFISDEHERTKYFSEVSRTLKAGGIYFFLAPRKEGRFHDIYDNESLFSQGFIKRKIDGMLERVYTEKDLITFLSNLTKVELQVESEHTRAFGDEKFIRENGFWFGAFRKD